MFKKGISAREKGLIWMLGILTAGYLGFEGFYKPLNRRSTDLEKRIALTQKKLRKNLLKIQHGQRLEGNGQAIMEQFQQKGSDEQEMSTILSEIEAVADTLNLKISDQKPQKTHRVDFYNVFAVTLTVDGGLTDILHFIYTVQEKPHMFDIDEMQITKRSHNSPEVMCRLDLSRQRIP
jgi:Tfp pilus assembly protein PilO